MGRAMWYVERLDGSLPYVEVRDLTKFIGTDDMAVLQRPRVAVEMAVLTCALPPIATWECLSLMVTLW